MLHIPKKALLIAGNRVKPQEVFATSLWSGSGGARNINNGLDLAGKNGLVWIKNRNTAGINHIIADTRRGPTKYLISDQTSAENTFTDQITGFLSNGFSLTADTVGFSNSPSGTYVGWAAREARGFLSIVTYTGNGVAGRQIPHDLGGVPGMIMVKARNSAQSWSVYHRSLGATQALALDQTSAAFSGASSWNSTAPTATAFTVGTSSTTNASGTTYVAYVFAQNPDLIDCGSYVGNGSATGPVVTCGSGWAPQWLLIKSSTNNVDWLLYDATRSIGNPRQAQLEPNTSDAELSASSQGVDFIAPGFQPKSTDSRLNGSGASYIYMAVRSPT